MDNMMIKRLYEEAATLHKQAMDILKEFEGQDMAKEKATQVDQLLDQVETKTAEAKRQERAADADKFLNDPVTQKAFFKPGDAGKQGDALDMTVAFNAFARKDYSGMHEDERKVLFVGEATAGGYLVTDTYLNTILAAQQSMSVMRQICQVLPPVPSGSVIAPTEDDTLSEATWTTELLTGSEDTAKPFGNKKLTPHPLAKRIKVSNTFLRNPTFDAEGWVRGKMAQKFNLPEEAAYINGTGAQQPLGLLNTVNLPTYTTAAALTVTADDLINWVYRLPAAYAGRATILCNRAFIRKVRLLKDSNGQYLWQPGLGAGSPGVLLDTPYVFSDKMDDGLSSADAWETTAKVAVIGDFSYYWILDSLSLSMQRLVELYAETNMTGYIGRKESDGMCVMPEAFYALVIQ